MVVAVAAEERVASGEGGELVVAGPAVDEGERDVLRPEDVVPAIAEDDGNLDQLERIAGGHPVDGDGNETGAAESDFDFVVRVAAHHGEYAVDQRDTRDRAVVGFAEPQRVVAAFAGEGVVAVAAVERVVAGAAEEDVVPVAAAERVVAAEAAQHFGARAAPDRVGAVAAVDRGGECGT